MYLNQFSVRIPEGAETSGGYVELPHNTQYTLILRNDRNERCDARVEVDGKHVGTWRIMPHNNIRLERPAHDEARFTFYKLGTVEGNQVGLKGGDPNLGLVKVTFTPEWKYESVINVSYASTPESLSGSRGAMSDVTASVTRSAGGTGLSGHSGQRFVDAPYITYDHSQQTVIHLRLVCKNGDEPRPLTAYSTPVPPPVR